MANNNLTRNILEGTITQEEANQLRTGEVYSDSTRGMSDLARAIYDEKKAEESTMTNTMSQLMSFLQTLFAPKAHDEINNIIGENEYTLEQIQSGQVGEERLPSLAPEQLQNNAMLDSLLGRRAQGWPPGPNVMSTEGNTYGDGDNVSNSLIEALMMSQGEFGAAQPVPPRLMPR